MDNLRSNQLMHRMLEILSQKFGESLDQYLIPPPVFTFMEGEFVEFDQEQGWLRARFPIKPAYLNPYKVMQGGMIAAAIDNTLGPLSILLADPNVTRTLEIKYSAPITLEMKHFIVFAKLERWAEQELFFKAEARSEQGKLLARALARHWIHAAD